MACPNVNRAAKRGAEELETTADSQIDEDQRLGIAQASAYMQTTLVTDWSWAGLC